MAEAAAATTAAAVTDTKKDNSNVSNKESKQNEKEKKKSGDKTSRRLVEYFLIVSSVPDAHQREERSTGSDFGELSGLEVNSRALDYDFDVDNAKHVGFSDVGMDGESVRMLEKDRGVPITNSSSTGEELALHPSMSSASSSSSYRKKGARQSKPVKIEVVLSSNNNDNDDDAKCGASILSDDEVSFISTEAERQKEEEAGEKRKKEEQMKKDEEKEKTKDTKKTSFGTYLRKKFYVKTEAAPSLFSSPSKSLTPSLTFTKRPNQQIVASPGDTTKHTNKKEQDSSDDDVNSKTTPTSISDIEEKKEQDEHQESHIPIEGTKRNNISESTVMVEKEKKEKDVTTKTTTKSAGVAPVTSKKEPQSWVEQQQKKSQQEEKEAKVKRAKEVVHQLSLSIQGDDLDESQSPPKSSGEKEHQLGDITTIPSLGSTSQSEQSHAIASASSGSNHYLDAHEVIPSSSFPEYEMPPEKDITQIVNFKPQVTSRYPTQDHTDTQPLNTMVPTFCFPDQDVIHVTEEYKMPTVHHFALTDGIGRRMYGTCLTVYEEYVVDASSRFVSDYCAELWWRAHRGEIKHSYEYDEQFEDAREDNNAKTTPTNRRNSGQEIKEPKESFEMTICSQNKRIKLYLPRVICLLSEWPYLTAFREYLTQLYKLATTTKNLMKVPIERYVINICAEVPAPPPGKYELRVNVFPKGSSANKHIRFWAPPANQPISWVALPNNILFECLDVDNVIVAWYALTLERKVLLVSSQCSTLSICAEILCSFLFPMTWNHLYIPVLPRSVCTMLGAPMPYLCGVVRDNLDYALDNACGEAIVIDLDKNVITAGECMPDLPPIPQRRLKRLEEGLKLNCGDVYWKARGIKKKDIDYMENMKKSTTEEMSEVALERIVAGDKVWEEKLSRFDDAFDLALTPDSLDMLLNDETYGDTGSPTQSKWDKVQETFLLFYAAIFKDYRKYIARGTGLSDFLPNNFSSINGSGVLGSSVGVRPPPSDKVIDNKQNFFYRDLFISAQWEEYKPFLKEFCTTQQFDSFITKRLNNPYLAEAIFFDETIEAKKNQSRLRVRKAKTPFLLSAKAHQKLKVINAIQPNEQGLSSQTNGDINEADATSSEISKTYSYERWPEKFDENLYGEPRPISTKIKAEFDKQDSFILRSKPSPTVSSWSEKFFGIGANSEPSSPMRRNYSFRRASFQRKKDVTSPQDGPSTEFNRTSVKNESSVQKSSSKEEIDSVVETVDSVDDGNTSSWFQGPTTFKTGDNWLDGAFGFLNTHFFCGGHM